MNLVSTDNISVISLNRVTILPGVKNTADRRKETGITVPAIPVEDFGYLKFEIAKYYNLSNLSSDEQF